MKKKNVKPEFDLNQEEKRVDYLIKGWFTTNSEKKKLIEEEVELNKREK